MNILTKRAIFLATTLKQQKQLQFSVSKCYAYGAFNHSQGLNKVHGRIVFDENTYLKSDELAQENMIYEERAHFDEFLQKIESDINKYHSVSVKRKEISQVPYPEKNGKYNYYSKPTHYKENDYEIIYRTENEEGAKEESVLDMIQIPFLKISQQTKCSLTRLVLSDNQDALAFIIDPNNDENLVAGFKDIKTNRFLKDKLINCANLVFSKQNQKIVYYVAHDGKKRTCAIKRHEIGTPQENDTTLFEEQNEGFYLDIKVSKDKEYIIIHSSSKKCNEVMVIDRKEDGLEKPNIDILFSRDENQRAFANHARGKFFLIVTEEGVYDSKIVTLNDESFRKKNLRWQDYYLPELGEIITEIDLFQNYTIIYIEKEGVSHIKVKEAETNLVSDLDLHEAIGRIEPGINEDYITDEFVFHFNNPFIYNSVFKYNLKNSLLTKVYESKLSGPRFDKKDYVYERIHAPGHDGEEIPITIIRKKNAKMDRRNKLLLIGYGAYGQPLDVSFNIVNMAAIEQGWIIAYAHVRGGNEKGRDWHNNGKGEHKINSFKDYISCAEFLVAEKYTHPSLLCAFGSSAGGLLVGATINMRPDLFKAVILNVPFLDALNSLLDKDLPLTLTDHDEFGNPIESERAMENISSYCPYENLNVQEYPAVLITSGTLDYRCPLWNVLKYVKRFRHRALHPERISEFAPKNILLNITEGGHAGEIGTVHGIKEKSLYFGFLDYVLLNASKEIKIKQKMVNLA